jgi:isopenicillin N synthase-like dioxygenase
MTARVTVPVVEIADLTHDDPVIGASLVESGFAIIRAHGVTPLVWQHACDVGRAVFALPNDVKDQHIGPADGSQRGYLPLRTVLPDGRDALDRKECWHARRRGHRLGNIFPNEVPEFGPVTDELIAAIDVVVDRVLASIDAFLRQPIGTLAAAIRGGDSLLRFNHYPVSDADLGFRPHRDFDIITLLLGADRPGLEIQGRDGTWHPVTPSAGAIVVNAGDILEVESGGRIPSTAHRVVAPSAEHSGRLSMVYFVSPRREHLLCSGVTAGDFIDLRLRDAGYLR